MIKRRQFLGGLAAFGGSTLLAACGGSNAEDGGSVVGSTVSKATARASAASADNTAIPPASSITDSSGGVWTLSGGLAYLNGQVAGGNYNTSLVLWYGGSIYCKNIDARFYQWTGTGWQACPDPHVSPISPDGTTLPSASYITDKSGDKWTLVNAVVYKNGSVVGPNFNVALVLWYGGKIYHCNSAGNWYVNAEVSVQWLACTDPRIAVAPTAGSFYGTNGHADYTYTPAELVSILKGLGCTNYRVGCGNNSSDINAVIKLAQAFQPAGIQLLVLLNQGLHNSNGQLFTSESSAYTAAYSTAAAVANALKPYGVAVYECGNELTRDGAIIIDSTYAGTKAVDFNNKNWPVLRGVLRGMIDGVKSVQSNAKCGVNFCVNDVGASDALWEGSQPDGSSGYPKVRWDITTWHNYEVYGNIFNIGTDGAGPGFDLPTYCKARYGVPFIITEWNTGPEQTAAYRANYITTQLTQFYQARKTHNIQSVMYYVLDSGSTTFGMMINGSPINPAYSAFTSFTASNPDK